jgi:hypothetical protein
MKHMESLGIKGFAAAIAAVCTFWMTYGTASMVLNATFDSALSLFFFVWFLIGTWVLGVFVMLAAWEAWKYADDLQSNRFRERSARNRLIRIRNRSCIVFGLWMLQLPTAYFVANREDAPGLILFAAALLFLPAGVALFALLLLKTTSDGRLE